MNTDPDILVGLSDEQLQALAEGMLVASGQDRLNDLLRRNTQRLLSAEELADLDRLLARIDQLTILKARARYTLRQQTLDSKGPAHSPANR